jgi:hypothetical protein
LTFGNDFVIPRISRVPDRPAESGGGGPELSGGAAIVIVCCLGRSGHGGR